MGMYELQRMKSPTGPGYSIRKYSSEDIVAVEAMYAGFQPLGSALGLPPPGEERTDRWLRYLDHSGFSLIAQVDYSGNVVGHAVLADGAPAEAELAVFVHQDFRARGIGSALAGSAIEEARRLGYRRLWAATSPSNAAAIRMVKGQGFRIVSLPSATDTELELILD